ncbi:MAG: hypothetical protein KY466_14760, partial [Gemmatimonadetes bacterium]|nr:hypothetical protein [Gemmatimonadota bacterium]
QNCSRRGAPAPTASRRNSLRAALSWAAEHLDEGRWSASARRFPDEHHGAVALLEDRAHRLAGGQPVAAGEPLGARGRD